MNNLKYYRKLHKKTQKDIADFLGIVQQAYGHYETGRRQIPLENLMKLASYYQVSIDELAGNQVIDPPGRPIQEKPEIEFEEEVQLPIVASLKCGYGQSGEPYTIIGRHGVPKSYIKKYGKELLLVYATGESMIPTILPGELMVCYPSNWWDDGTVVVININDSDTVKRIYHAKDGGIDLIPDNPAYKIMHYTQSEIEDYRIHILAHVVTTIPQEIRPIPRRDE